ncbi:hypothetical protein BKA70DRAFT_1336439 [Coprinopsis sp. MPI-PUGE-AT-0042]|nr:hypothetical protein BKA70DRAFT_1336439 [Coprinopsis sp. MPI-PUGE-AT-0042]
MLASGNGQEDIVKQLLAHSNAQVNMVDNEGWSALIMAVNRGHERIALLLLGIPHINTMLKTTDSGHTAMSMALAGGYDGIVRLLDEFESPSIRINPCESSDFTMDQLSLEEGIDEDARSVATGSEESDVYYDAVESETYHKAQGSETYHDAEERSESAEPIQPM